MFGEEYKTDAYRNFSLKKEITMQALGVCDLDEALSYLGHHN
jgi:hypothetical protein